MYLTPLQTLLLILVIAFATMLTRFLPFFLFPEHKKTPNFILYLGKYLPPAMIGLLVVYCLKGVTFTTAPYGFPETLAILCIILLHTVKRNTLLSIGGGTILYILLLQF